MKLNLKNMIIAYKRTHASETTWEAFHRMYAIGFIDGETWKKFYKKCHSWDYRMSLGYVIDTDTGEKVDCEC